MDEKISISGCTILTYLRKNGVEVDDTLCQSVPEIATKAGITPSRVERVVDILCDDTHGRLSDQFPNYYNRFPEETLPSQVGELKKAFQLFVQQVLFPKTGKKPLSPGITIEAPLQPDVLGERIDAAFYEIRGKWLHWGIDQNYKFLMEDIRSILPLLGEKYEDPILESIAGDLDEEITDTIPDKYIVLLSDILLSFYIVHDAKKLSKIQEDIALARENVDILNDIHYIVCYLYHILGWTIFQHALKRDMYSINEICRQIIASNNNLHFWLQENGKKVKRQDKKPPEEK